jgi:hypothetical protein
MSKERAERSFRFQTQWSMVELTGLFAHNLRELVAHLKTVPGSAIYYHTHHFLKQHQSLSPEPPNDFAYWTTNVLGVVDLGERLASIDTISFSSIRSLREKFISIIESYIQKTRQTRHAPEGQEFCFMKSRSFIVPTPYEVWDLKEFARAISKISVFSLYHHMFEARLRLERGTNDFSNWLEKELQEMSLANSISRLDPYTQPLENLRAQILKLTEMCLIARIREADDYAS